MSSPFFNLAMLLASTTSDGSRFHSVIMCLCDWVLNGMEPSLAKAPVQIHPRLILSKHCCPLIADRLQIWSELAGLIPHFSVARCLYLSNYHHIEYRLVPLPAVFAEAKTWGGGTKTPLSIEMVRNFRVEHFFHRKMRICRKSDVFISTKFH